MNRKLSRYYDLYLLLSLPLLWYIIFMYVPMYGAQIAFKDFIPTKGILGSPWAGLTHFKRFFGSYYFFRLLRNTLGISLYTMAIGFPLPIILAIMVNEIRHERFKKAVQNATYIPYFFSVVVIVGMINVFLAPGTGLVSHIMGAIGLDKRNLLEDAGSFKTIYTLTNVWQNCGWNSIIYIAALTSIDGALYDAASIDGVTRLQKILHISLPSITPTIVIMFILRIGQIMNIGFEKVLLMQNPMNMESSDVISTFVYRYGVQQADYSFATAVGLFNSLINLVLLLLINKICARLGETSLW